MALLCLIHATFHSSKNRENYQIYSTSSKEDVE